MHVRGVIIMLLGIILHSNIERATYGLYSFINAAKPTRITVIDEDEVDPPIGLTTTESSMK